MKATVYRNTKELAFPSTPAFPSETFNFSKALALAGTAAALVLLLWILVSC